MAEQGFANVDRRPRWRRRIDGLLRDPWSAVMTVVGDGTVGGRSVPTTWRHGRIEGTGPSDPSSLHVSVENDAFALSLRRLWPHPDRDAEESAVYDLNRREARWLAWWIVRWFAADWFGLRRRVYYTALHRHLARYERLRVSEEGSRTR